MGWVLLHLLAFAWKGESIRNPSSFWSLFLTQSTFLISTYSGISFSVVVFRNWIALSVIVSKVKEVHNYQKISLKFEKEIISVSSLFTIKYAFIILISPPASSGAISLNGFLVEVNIPSCSCARVGWLWVATLSSK